MLPGHGSPNLGAQEKKSGTQGNTVRNAAGKA